MDPPENVPAQPAQSSTSTKRPFSEFAQDYLLPTPKLVLMHTDAIVDGRKALTYTIAKVISIVSPETKPPTDDEILATVASTPNTIEIYRSLGAIAATPTEAKEWCLRHKNIMKRGGAKHRTVYPEVEPFLQCLRERRIPVLLATSAKDTVMSLVKEWGFKHLIDGVIGDAHEFLGNKDRFAHDIKTVFDPWMANHDLGSDVPLDMTTSDKYEPAPLRPDEIMVVSCCPYNLVKVQELGVQTCWVKKSDASIEAGGETEFVVDDLDGLAQLIKNHDPNMSETKLPNMSETKVEIAEDEAVPSDGHLENVQEGAKEANEEVVSTIDETQHEQTNEPHNQVELSHVKSEFKEQAALVEEANAFHQEGTKTATPDEDVVMLDVADGEEPILATDAVENAAAGDQTSDTDALYVYASSSDDVPNDDAPNKSNEAKAHEQVPQYEDAQHHESPQFLQLPQNHESPQSPQLPQTPQMASSSPKIFSSPQMPSSQATAFLEQIPSSPPTSPQTAISPQQTSSSEQVTKDKTSQQKNNDTPANAARDTDSPLSDIIDLSD